MTQIKAPVLVRHEIDRIIGTPIANRMSVSDQNFHGDTMSALALASRQTSAAAQARATEPDEFWDNFPV